MSAIQTIRILVAHEVRSYRTTITAAIQRLRPQHTIVSVEPDDALGELEHFQPHLVIGCKPCFPTAYGNPTWVTLYPQGDNRVDVRLEGEIVSSNDLDLPALLALIDRTAELADHC